MDATGITAQQGSTYKPRLQEIECSICQKPVDEIHLRFDDVKQLIWVAAKCHGEIVFCRFPVTVLLDPKIEIKAFKN